ncbi:RNA-binding protein Nova-1-like [Ptychodera flava]|uniref:RNA-binding protein Nova-1-like n=1 Tax=Ptychodera flava TaxID=63121 RepID=UPI00396A91A5
MATEFASEHEQLNVDLDATDSRKRPLEGDGETGMSKRSNIGGNDDNKYVLKMLIPSAAAGSVIGKGGQTVVQLQRETGANIKLSKSNDYYPGTTERIVLITGTVEALSSVGGFVIEKVRDSPQLAAKSGNETAVSQERARQVKMVIPNSTAGLIIGKGGATIKAFMEQSGAKLQISQKSEGVNLSERVLTISGELEPSKKALSAVIGKLQEDPQSGSCNNISYATITGPVANASPTGSPFAEAALANVKPQIALATGTSASLPSVGLGLGLGLGGTPRVTTSSYSGTDVAAISAAMNTLASYGYNVPHPSLGSYAGAGSTSPILNSIGSATPSSSTAALPSSLLGSYQAAAAAAAAANGTSPTLRNGTAFEGTAAAVNGAAGFSLSSEGALPFGSLASFGGLGSLASFGSGTEAPKDGTKDTSMEIEVPETLVGAILGKGGKTLVEFQQCSGARIQISKKGEYVPGTRNRKVTITGNPLATQTAHYLITQRVTQEEQNRALKGTN